MRKRLPYAAAFVLLTAAEVLIAKFVHDRFVRPYIGDVLVVMVIYAFVRIFIPEGHRWLPAAVFAFAVSVELMQYFDIVHLLGLGGSAVMSTAIGSVFDLGDIACYAVGCALLALHEYCSSQKKKCLKS